MLAQWLGWRLGILGSWVQAPSAAELIHQWVDSACHSSEVGEMSTSSSVCTGRGALHQRHSRASRNDSYTGSKAAIRPPPPPVYLDTKMAFELQWYLDPKWTQRRAALAHAPIPDLTCPVQDDKIRMVSGFSSRPLIGWFPSDRQCYELESVCSSHSQATDNKQFKILRLLLQNICGRCLSFICFSPPTHSISPLVQASQRILILLLQNQRLDFSPSTNSIQFITEG